MTNSASTLPVAVTQLTFDDEFNTFSGSADGSSGVWMTTLPYGGEAAYTLSGNNEAEYYSGALTGSNSPFSDEDGILTMSAFPGAAGSNPYGLPYTSGVITTYGSFSQSYGYFEIDAKLPSGQGLWPAFWMLPASDDYTSELDIFEKVDSQDNTVYSTVHGATNDTWYADSQAVTTPNNASGFNVYGVNWGPVTTTFYINGVEVASEPTPQSMDTPMFMLINLAVGGTGSWPGAPDASTVFPADMEINWVRAYATADTTYVGGSAAIPAADSALDEAQMQCFCTGTLLRTPDGPRAVEALRVGDRLITRDGGAQPIVWLAHRTIECPRPKAWPVRVQAGALGAGLPVRDLFLSPDHAVMVEDMLVPVRELVDGAAIAQMAADSVTYWHAELAVHDVVFAEDLPVESYLDIGERGFFGVSGIRTSPEEAAAKWSLACAPLLIHGEKLANLRARIRSGEAVLF